jgi:hypothetical protein
VVRFARLIHRLIGLTAFLADLRSAPHSAASQTDLMPRTVGKQVAATPVATHDDQDHTSEMTCGTASGSSLG